MHGDFNMAFVNLSMNCNFYLVVGQLQMVTANFLKTGYLKTKTIVLENENDKFERGKAAEVKDKLTKYNLELESETMQQSTTYAKNLHSDLEWTTVHLHITSQHDCSNINVSPKPDAETQQFKSNFDRFDENINRKLELLADEAYAIKENIPYSIIPYHTIVLEQRA